MSVKSYSNVLERDKNVNFYLKNNYEIYLIENNLGNGRFLYHLINYKNFNMVTCVYSVVKTITVCFAP